LLATTSTLSPIDALERGELPYEVKPATGCQAVFSVSITVFVMVLVQEVCNNKKKIKEMHVMTMVRVVLSFIGNMIWYSNILKKQSYQFYYNVNNATSDNSLNKKDSVH